MMANALLEAEASLPADAESEQAINSLASSLMTEQSQEITDDTAVIQAGLKPSLSSLAAQAPG
jgi:hypothetical protein